MTSLLSVYWVAMVRISKARPHPLLLEFLHQEFLSSLLVRSPTTVLLQVLKGQLQQFQEWLYWLCQQSIGSMLSTDSWANPMPDIIPE